MASESLVLRHGPSDGDDGARAELGSCRRGMPSAEMLPALARGGRFQEGPWIYFIGEEGEVAVCCPRAACDTLGLYKSTKGTQTHLRASGSLS